MPYADPAKANAYAKAYGKAHPESRRKARRAYYLKNRERLLERARIYAKRERARYRANQQVWRRNNPRYQKNSNLRHKYGITLAEYETMLAAQGGLCYLCEQPGSMTVDHDHNTGKVRKLLCIGCNGALGRFERTILSVGLERVLAYIGGQ